MNNAEISVDGKRIVTSCTFQIALDQEALIKFSVAEDEDFLIKLRIREQERSDLSIEQKENSIEWEFLFTIQENALGLSLKRPAVFAQNEFRKLYYTATLSRIKLDDDAFNVIFTVYEEALENGS